MTSRDFCFWLQGLFEVGKPESLTKEQTDMVKAHLDLVFEHEIAPAAAEKRAARTTTTVATTSQALAEISRCGLGGVMIC